MLSDREILEEIKEKNIIIENFELDCLRPSSYLLRLEKEIFSLKSGSEIIDTKSTDTKTLFDGCIMSDDGFILKAGNLYLLSSVEKISLSASISAEISLLSCYARIGLNGNFGSTHITSTFGYNCPSSLTFEIINGASRKIKIYPGVKFFHIKFFRHRTPSVFRYQGIYSNQSRPKPSDFSCKPAR